MCCGSILSCCPCKPHGHERVLKKEEEDITKNHYSLPRIKSHSIIKVFDLKKMHFSGKGSNAH